MSWSGQGGGGGNSGGPWGRGPEGNGQGPWNKGQPPDIEAVLRRGQEQLRKLLPGGSGPGRSIALAGGVLLALWAATGI